MLANASGFVNGIRQNAPAKNGDKGFGHFPANGLPNVRVRNTFLEPVLIEEETLSVSDRAATEPGFAKYRKRPSCPASDADGDAPAYVSVRSDDRQMDVRWVSLGSMRNMQPRPKLALAEALAEQHELDRLGDPEVAKEALRERALQSEFHVGGTTSVKSAGSALHPNNCTECHFHAFKPGGCRAGKDCHFCHELHPRKNPRKNRRFMRRILGREAGSGTTATTYPTDDMEPEDTPPTSTPRSNEVNADDEVGDPAMFNELNVRQNNIKESPGLPKTVGPQPSDIASFMGLNGMNVQSSPNKKEETISNLPTSIGLGTSPMPKEASSQASSQQDSTKKSTTDEATTSQKSRNPGFISLRYTTEEPPARPESSANGNAPMVLNLVAGVQVDMPALVDIAPEKRSALQGHLEFTVSPPLPDGLALDNKTGMITGVPYKVQETTSVHQVTVSVESFGRGGIPLMMLALTSCQVALRIVDLQSYTISWVRQTDENDAGDQIVLKLQKF